jgi:hypothetical protein
MPSLRRAATDHAEMFRDYIQASPDWHVFVEQGNRFAARRWSYGEEPSRLAGKDGKPFRLLTGMQPGIYGIVYSLNPGESGFVYLKAFEVTKGTPLSVDRLKAASETRMAETRMAWSADPAERFGAKSGFTIYEGDWGKPYAARFEVWFKPDSGGTERKFAERIFKIEGWQR